MSSSSAVALAPAIGFLDDDDDFLETIRNWLGQVGSVIRATTDVDECLEWIRRREVKVAVSDLRMPACGGVDVLERAREMDRGLELYLLTGYDPDQSEGARLRAIHAQVVRKPDLSEFLASLAEPQPEGAVQQMVDLQSRVELLEREHREWVRDLTDQLAAIPNLDEAFVSAEGEGFSVGSLLDDIQRHTPRGLEHIRLWRRVMSTLRQSGRLRP